MAALAVAGLAMLLVAAAAITPSSASARAGELQKNRAKARTLAAGIAALDAKIDAAVQRSSQATKSLVAVRGQLRDNRRMQRFSRRELEVARAALEVRAVALYKHDDVTALDAVFTADDFGELVSQLTMVQRVARGDGDVVGPSSAPSVCSATRPSSWPRTNAPPSASCASAPVSSRPSSPSCPSDEPC